jgi:hypothetical protein
VDELASSVLKTFSMGLCLSINTIPGVGLYVDNEAYKNMNFNKKSFDKLQDRGGIYAGGTW